MQSLGIFQTCLNEFCFRFDRRRSRLAWDDALPVGGLAIADAVGYDVKKDLHMRERRQCDKRRKMAELEQSVRPMRAFQALAVLILAVAVTACGSAPSSDVAMNFKVDDATVSQEEALAAAGTAVEFNDPWRRLVANRRAEVIAVTPYDNPGAPGLLVDVRLIPPPDEDVSETVPDCGIPGSLIGFRRLVSNAGKVEATAGLYTGGSCLG